MPSAGLPRFGTQVSGVVIKKLSVTIDIPNVSSPPISPSLGNQMPSSTSVPIVQIIAPIRYETA